MKTNLACTKRISTLLSLIFFGLATISHCPIVFAQCPSSTPPSINPPNSIVRVQILSVKPNSDMEGDDDYIPFYDNHADIFGEVTIDAQVFNLPEIEDSDFPHWDDIFEKQVASSPVKITIKIFEDDYGLTGDNDVVDVNPSPESDVLDLEFDLCALVLRLGSNEFSTQGVVEINAGSGDSQATIRLKVETADGRPVTSDDLAIVEADLVQVLFHSPKLISGKPTILLVRIANNYSTSITTNVHVAISGGGLNKNDVFPVTIGSGEVKKEYFYLNNPFRFPESASSYAVALLVRLDDLNNQNLPTGDCKRLNDGNNNRLIWKTVHTPRRYSLMWTKVGTLLDGFNFASDGQLQENIDLGGAFIHGVYPLSFPNNYKAPFDVMPPLTAAVDFLTTILSVFGIPADNVLPFALAFELNGVANITGCERLMGVLPNKDWFSRFSYGFFDDVTGLSLGEFAPRAVIFLPEHDDGTDVGPCMTLPAHELGHTFGLSTDPRLKDSWVCQVDWPILGSAACGIVGGFDEYKSTTFPNGNPSDGFWISQGNEPTAIAGLLNQEQCGSFCLMAGSPVNAHLNWAGKKRWIDAADYDQLIKKLQKGPDPEVIYVSGIISWDDKLLLGSIQHIGRGIADRDTSYGAYAIRFFDRAGKLLKEVGIPVYWSSPDFSARPRPVTFFGLNVVYPENARLLQVINRMSAKVLGSINISAQKPAIKLQGLSKSTIARAVVSS